MRYDWVLIASTSVLTTVANRDTRTLERENCSAKFWLDPGVRLESNHGYGRRELREIERIVRENLELET